MSHSNLEPRKIDVSFDALPPHWFGGNAFASHLINGLHLLFPAGERFFIRSVKRYLPEVEDQELLEQAKGFFGQESQHAAHHERCFAALEAQGLPVKAVLAAYEKVAFGVIEPLTPPKLRLAITAAMEHFTATLADLALTDNLLDNADPSMRELLRWHAAEEIEHKAVAFDVLEKVGGGHALRVAGLVAASALLGTFWFGTTVAFLASDRTLSRDQLWGDLKQARERSRLRRAFRQAFRDYVRRDFHPSQIDNATLAADYLRTARAKPVRPSVERSVA